MATQNELRAAQNAIAQALAQHASYQYRASSAVVNAVSKEIQALAGTLVIDLLPLLEGITPAEARWFLAGQYKTTRLKRLRDAIFAFGDGAGFALKREWDETAPKLAAYEAGYAATMLSQAVDGLPKIDVAGEAIYRKAMQTPMSGGAPYGGKLVQDLLGRFPRDQADRVMAAVKSGVVSGQTSNDIVRAIRGTKALNYQDGIAQIARGSAEMFVRTARNHISNQAMADTYEKLGVNYVVWVSTLDGRTSKICSVRDGMRWKIDEAHPVPPAHPNCRSALAPSMDGELIGSRPYVRALKVKKRDGSDRFRAIGDMTPKQREEAGLKVGQVQARTNYGKWFANQDAAYQQEWLGPKRYKLYKEGGYALDRFVDPRTGRQYNLNELRMRDEETFRQIFGE